MWRNLLTSRPALAVAVPAGLIIVGFCDYATGYEVLLSFFYLPPVALCAWHFGRTAIAVASATAGIIWFVADYTSQHIYESSWHIFWNASMCSASTLVLGFALYQLRLTLREREAVNHALQSALQKLESSTREARELTTNLQIVCAWTQRIQIEGKWMNLDEFLAHHLHLKVSHGMSPEAFAKLRAEMKAADNLNPLE